jgi:hypothetical protein
LSIYANRTSSVIGIANYIKLGRFFFTAESTVQSERSPCWTYDGQSKKHGRLILAFRHLFVTSLRFITSIMTTARQTQIASSHGTKPLATPDVRSFMISEDVLLRYDHGKAIPVTGVETYKVVRC